MSSSEKNTEGMRAAILGPVVTIIGSLSLTHPERIQKNNLSPEQYYGRFEAMKILGSAVEDIHKGNLERAEQELDLSVNMICDNDYGLDELNKEQIAQQAMELREYTKQIREHLG